MVTEISRILITGADGFVGRWLAATLRERYAAAHIAGTGLVVQNDDGSRMIALDLRDAAAVDAVVAAERPDVIVHLAAISTVADARSDVDLAMDVNLLGTMRLARAVLRHVPAARFLYVSSSDVYGATFARWPVPLDEDAPLAPTNSYAASKAAADLLIGQLSISDGLRALRLRPFNHTGPGQDARFVVPSFARQIARMEAGLQEPMLAVGNLESFREFLDVRDVVRAYADAIGAADALFDGRALNLAGGRPVKIRVLLDRLIAMALIPIDVVIDPARYRQETDRFAGGDARCAFEQLGWRPEIPLDETLRSVLEAERAAIGAT